MKVKTPTSQRTRLKKRHIEFKSESDLPKYGQIEGLEIEGVLFSLLDGLVETNEKIKETIIKTLMKFASFQPDFILKSILTFLQVQKTSIQHQYILLNVIKKCILELKNVPNSIVKEILLFVLKELSFIKEDDPRHSEMKEIVNASTLLCPMFGVDVTLALIKDINQGEEYHEILTIYIRVLKKLCEQVPNNSYVKSILISSHLMGLYNKEIFKEQNSKISKELSSLLFKLSKMLIISGNNNQSSMNSFGTLSSRMEEEGNENNSYLYKSLDLENNTFREFCHVFNKENILENCDNKKKQINHMVSPQLTTRDKKNEKKIIRPTMDNIKNILEPLYELMLDYYIPKIYINQSYNKTCLELLYSLMIMTEFISIECLKNNSMNLLTCVIVRFINQVPNLEFEDNLWFKLHKINSSTLTTKFVSLFSNQNSPDDIPPKFFIEGLIKYLQILSNYDEYVICTNSYNLCNIFFSLILIMYKNKSDHLIRYLKALNGNEDNKELDSEYIESIIKGIRTMFEISSSSLMVLEFLYDKATSKSKSEMVVSLYVYIFLLKTEIEGNESSNRLMVYKIINNSSKILNSNINDNYSLYIILEFIKMLFENNYVNFFKLFTVSIKSNEEEGLVKKRSKKIYNIMNYVFEYQINIEISKRIENNLKIYNSKEDNKLDSQFFSNLYQNNTNSKHEGGTIKFVRSELVYDEEELFEKCIKVFIKYEGEEFLEYLYTKLMNNVKRNSLTVLKYINKIFKRYQKEKLIKVLEEEERLNLLTIALIYIHDPIGWFGEAYFSFKLIFVLYNLCFERKELNLEKVEKEMIKIEGVEINHLNNYNKLDSFYIKQCNSDDDDDNNYNYNNNNKEEEEETYLNVNNIVSNFMNVSKLIKALNKLYEVEGSKITKTISRIMKKLKNVQKLERTSSFSFATPSFLNSSSTIFSSSSSNLLKMNDIVIDTDLSKYQNLGILNLICIFTNHSNVKRIIKSIMSTKGMNMSSDKEEFMIVNKEEDRLKENDKKIWSINLDIKYTYLMLNSICISNLSNEKNLKEVLNKLDYLLLINPIKDSSFSIFGKTSSYLQSEKIRLIIMSTLINIYLQNQKYFNSNISNDNDNNVKVDNKVEVNIEKDDKMTILKERYNRIKNQIQEKRLKLLKEKEKEAKREDNEEFENEDVLNTKLTEEDINENEDKMERFIICPIISMFNSETDQIIQEYILNNILIIVNNYNSNNSLNNNNEDNIDENENKMELFSVIFDSLIKIIMKCVDRSGKVSSKNIKENYENIQMLNLSKIERELNEKEQGLPMYAFMTMCAFGPHFRSLRETETPYILMYYVIYYSEYHLFTRIAKFQTEFPISYNLHRSLRVSKCVQYYLKEVYRNLSRDLEGVVKLEKNELNWKILYKMVIIIMSNNNSNLENILIRSKLFVLVEFLNEILVNESISNKGEDEWIQIVIILWCYILKIVDNNIKILLIDTLYSLLNLNNDQGTYNNTKQTTHNNLIKERLKDDMSVKLDRISKLNSVDNISHFIPQDLIVKFFSFSLSLLEKPSCLSNSLIKIIHRICQSNINIIPRDKLKNSLELTFDRYSQYFEGNNLPMFLKLFLVDLFKHDIKILLEMIFNLNFKLQSTVVSIIVKNQYLLSLLIDHLSEHIQKKLNKSFHLNPSFSYNDNNNLDNVSNNNKDDKVDDEVEVNNEKDKDKVDNNNNEKEDQDHKILEYNMIIFSNDDKLADCYSDYLNLVIIYLNVTLFELKEQSQSIKEELKELEDKILKFLEIFEMEDNPKKKSLLRYNVKIIGGNGKLLNSFLKFSQRVMSSETNESELREEELEKRNKLVNNVITKILVGLVKHKRLRGEDVRVLKMMKTASPNFELVYYYLKNMYPTKLNPYFNIFKFKYYEVNSKRKRFLSKLMECVVPSIEREEVTGKQLNHYMKALSIIIGVVTREGLKKYEDKVERIIEIVVKNKTFFVNKKLRHSYLMLFCEIMRYLTRKYKNIVKLNNLKSYFLFPTSVAILSKDTNHLQKITSLYFKLFVNLFFGNNFKVNQANIQEELLSALMVRGFLSNKCICNCNFHLSHHCNLNNNNTNFKKTQYKQDNDCLDGRNLCICYSFQLLYFVSFFLPNFSELTSKEKEQSSKQEEPTHDKVVVPPDIDDEFKRIKKMQLDKESSKVLFNTSNLEEELEEEFTDINQVYELMVPTNGSAIPYKNSDLIRGELFTEPTDITSYSHSSLSQPHKLATMTICPDMLVLLNVSDYSLKQGVPKCNLKYTSDSLDEYFVKYLNAKNLSLLQIKTLSAIKKSHLFISKTLYRFITMQKYLHDSPIQLSLFKTPSDYNFSFSNLSSANSNLNLEFLELVEDPLFFNSIRLSVFILTKSSLYFSKSSKEASPYRDFFSSSQTTSHSERDSVLIRKNQLIHFESLCNVVISRLCKLVEAQRFKLFTLKQLHHLSHIVPQ